MTKEEILRENDHSFAVAETEIWADDCVKRAMDQFAKQESEKAFNAAREMETKRRRSDMWAAAVVTEEYVYHSFEEYIQSNKE